MNEDLILNMENNGSKNDLQLAQNTEKLNLEQTQNEFLQTNLGQAINSGIDIGLKAILPDIIEDEIIKIKDSLITEGFSAAVETAIKEVSDIGKSLAGILTGKFESVSQIKKAVEKGGLIDTISGLLDTGIKWANNKGYISDGIANTLKTGKKALIKSIEDKIDNNLTEQAEAIEKIDGYINKWKEYYEEKNFNGIYGQH